MGGRGQIIFNNKKYKTEAIIDILFSKLCSLSTLNEKENAIKFVEKLKKDNKLVLLKGQQNKHIPGTNEYIDGKSYFLISFNEINEILQKYSGTGEMLLNKSGKWTHKERIYVDKFVGICYDINNNIVFTNKLTIHYKENGGAHIVPCVL